LTKRHTAKLISDSQLWWNFGGDKQITDKYRSFMLPLGTSYGRQLFTAYNFTDESLSLLIEESAVEMFQIVEVYLKKGDKIDFKQKLSERVEAETKYRKSRGFHSVLKEDDDNEEYTFRASVLKKYASSVLFLSTTIRREGVELEHFLFAIAAGLSMIFATIVAFYFQRYGHSFLFIALVVGYMFKDRIKGIWENLFAKYLENTLYDRRTTLHTQDGNTNWVFCGKKLTVQEKEIPELILRVGIEINYQLDNEGQGENIICYTQDVVLLPMSLEVYGWAGVAGIGTSCVLVCAPT
jgi:hypothetical protein